MLPLAMVYSIIMLVVIIMFIVEAIRHRTDVGKYARAGFWLGVIALLIDLVVLLLIGDGLRLSEAACFQIVLIDVLLVVKIAIFASVGIYCCHLLGLPSTPLMLSVYGPPPNAAVQSIEGQTACSSAYQVREVALVEEPSTPESDTNIEPASVSDSVPDKEPEPEPPNWNAAMAWALAVAGGSVAYSYLLFLWTKPALSEMLQQVLEVSESSLIQMGFAVNPTVHAIVVVFAFAFGEEILFRLGLQNYLAKILNLRGSRYVAAILITASIWSLGHANTLDPEWIKFVQIFPVGVAMGFLFRKFGLEACILAHGAFNVAMVFLAPYVIEI
jgi:membrane protease YdiL (CAAX protease family)